MTPDTAKTLFSKPQKQTQEQSNPFATKKPGIVSSNPYEQEIDFEESLDPKVDYQNFDLNRLDPEEVQKHKNKMESGFRRNSLKAGDPGFIYDLRTEFKPTETHDWDMDSD